MCRGIISHFLEGVLLKQDFEWLLRIESDGMLEVCAQGIHLAERRAHPWTTCARDALPAYL